MDDQRVAQPGQAKSPHRRGRRVALVVAAVAVLLLMAGGAYLLMPARRGSPASAVTDLASAAMSGDSARVAASVDTTSLVDSAVDDVFATDAQPSMLTSYLAQHPGVTEDQLKAKLRMSFDTELKEHVESGTLPKRIPIGNEPLKGLVAAVLAKQTVSSVQVEGGVAHAVVMVPFKGKFLKVRVRMQRSGDSWKVDRVENLADVLKQAGY